MCNLSVANKWLCIGWVQPCSGNCGLALQKTILDYTSIIYALLMHEYLLLLLHLRKALKLTAQLINNASSPSFNIA